MGLDIRLPVGLLFAAIGGLLIWFGLTSDPALYQDHALGLNINVAWGGAMAGFGALMLALALLRKGPAS
jgi:hypothetical protein